MFSFIYLLLFLFIRQPSSKKIEYKHTVTSTPDSLRKYVEYLCYDIPPRNHKHPEGLLKTRELILSVFRKYSSDVVTREWENGDFSFQNISAFFGDKSKEKVIIGAHYDVWSDFPGADDNASGVAALLELARLFNSSPPKIRVELIAYDSEEPPFFGGKEMGSFVHSLEVKQKNEKVRVMVCLEMIGYYSKKQTMSYFLMDLLYPKKGNFIAVVGRYKERLFVKQFKAGINGRGVTKAVGYCGPMILGVDLSDHRNFWNIGLNAVMITDTAFLRNPNYHTEKDLPSTLDYKKMSGVVDGVFSTIMAMEPQ